MKSNIRPWDEDYYYYYCYLLLLRYSPNNYYLHLNFVSKLQYNYKLQRICKLTVGCAVNEQKAFAFEVGGLGGHVRHLANQQCTNFTNLTMRCSSSSVSNVVHRGIGKVSGVVAKQTGSQLAV